MPDDSGRYSGSEGVKSKRNDGGQKTSELSPSMKTKLLRMRRKPNSSVSYEPKDV